MKKYISIVLLFAFVFLLSPVEIQSQDKPSTISFKSYYTAVVGQPFTCQTTIKTMLTVVLKYKLTRAPAGMTIDSVKGIVTWTPPSKGEFSAEIAAFIGTSKMATEVITIKVVGFMGTMSGIVKNDDGKPLKGILVSIYKKTTSTGPIPMNILFTALTDSLGAYQITKIDSGSYYVQARPSYEKILVTPSSNSNFEYAPAWYVDSPTMDNAAAVPVSNPTKVVINLTMHKIQKPTPVEVYITGTVTDNTGKPIKEATVIAELASKIPSGSVVIPAGSIVSNFIVNGLGLFANVLGQVKTDATGFYKIGVRSGGTYYVSSYAAGYQIQYYNQKSNFLEADKIEVKENVANINFKLSPLPVVKTKITGVVADSTNKPVIAKVILYSVGTTATAFTKIPRTACTDTLGNFIFENVPFGKYLFQAVPLKEFFPGWYKLNDCGVNEKKFADTVVIKNDLSVTGLKICVKKVKTTGGGKISGFVKSTGSGLSGAIVYAEGVDGQASSFAISNADGSYEVIDLGPDNYKVSADKIGFTSNNMGNSVIDYGASIFSSSVNFTMAGETTTDININYPLPESFELLQNYPNPFNPATVISYQTPNAEFVTLKVYDFLGKEVATLVNEYQPAGYHNVVFNTQIHSLSSGVYFYKLTAGEYSSTKKLVLMK